MTQEQLILNIKLASDSKNIKTINDLVKANKELAKVISSAPKEGAEGYDELKDVLDAAKKQFSENAKEIKKFNTELKTGEKESDIVASSLKGLSKTLKDLEKQYKNLSKEQREAAKGKELQKSILALRTELLNAEKGLGDFRRQVGNYGGAIAQLSPQLNAINSSISGLKDGLLGVANGFKTAGLAAKVFVTSLGAVGVVVGVITAALSKFQDILDYFGAISSGVGAAFDVVIERIGRFGIAFNKLLSLDFKGFAEDATDSFKGMFEEIQNDFSAARQLSQELDELRDREINSIIRLAELERDVAIARRDAEELATEDRKAAAREIQRAIALTEEQQRLEVGFARERAALLQQQVDLSTETTTAEDRQAANEATARAIVLEAKYNDELRGLQRRLNQLNKEQKDNTSELSKLQKLQNELTEAVKNQLLASEDYISNLEQLTEVTKQLNAVDEKFKNLMDSLMSSFSSTSGSLNFYNEQLNVLNQELGKAVIGSEEYKRLQNEILFLEANRSAAVGDLTKSIEQLNLIQEETLRTLGDAETELRLRQAAQAEQEALTGSALETASKRLEIQEKLDSDLEQLRINRIQDELDSLKTEEQNINESLQTELKIYADNELKKLELSIIAQGKRDELRKKQLELEQQLLDISVSNFNKAEQKKTQAEQAELQKRQQARELALDTAVSAANKIVELLSVIQKQATQEEEKQISKREESALNEAELLGKTEEEKQKIREKFNKEREQLEKKAAAERKALALSEAVIDIAGAVLKSLNSAPPANVGLAAATAALGAIQLAIIAATNFANGGLVQPVQLENGKIVNARNIPTMKNGDNILATVRTGEVILNKQQQKALGGDATFRKIGVPGFANGGKIAMHKISKTLPFANGGLVPRFSANIQKAKAYTNGGLAANNVSDSIIKEEERLADLIFKAVKEGAALGSKEGTEKANIPNQIARQNEREARRTASENF